MSHLASKCHCGRTIHFPKDAQIGYVWVCIKCGQKWVLSTHGEPTYQAQSKRPPQEPKKEQPKYEQSRSKQTTPSSKNSKSSSSGCMGVGIIILSAMAGTTYKIVEYFLT